MKSPFRIGLGLSTLPKRTFFRLNLGLNLPMFQYVASSSIMANKVFKYWSPRNQPPPRRMVHSVMSQMRDRVDRELKGKHGVKESDGGGLSWKNGGALSTVFQHGPILRR